MGRPASGWPAGAGTCSALAREDPVRGDLDGPAPEVHAREGAQDAVGGLGEVAGGGGGREGRGGIEGAAGGGEVVAEAPADALIQEVRFGNRVVFPARSKVGEIGRKRVPLEITDTVTSGKPRPWASLTKDTMRGCSDGSPR